MQGLQHIVIVPVQGKNSRIGVLVLGMPHYRKYTENDRNFLRAAAGQLGLAAENRRLVKQLLRTQNEWESSFNSVPDYVLVHEAVAEAHLRDDPAKLFIQRRSCFLDHHLDRVLERVPRFE